MNIIKNIENEKGIVLVAGLMLLAILAIVASTAYLIANTDVSISSNYKKLEDAFNQAEAGVQYGIGVIQNGLETETFSLPTSTGSGNAVALPSSSHSDYSFLLSSLEMTATNAFHFTSTGTGSQGATAKIDVNFKMGPAISLAVFGCEKMQAQLKVLVNSYDHNSPDPKPGEIGYVSTGQADVGSNEWVHLHEDSDIDGDIYLVPGGTFTPNGSKNEAEVDDLIPPLDCDPLHVTDTSYDAKFTANCPTSAGWTIENATETIVYDSTATSPGIYCYQDLKLKATGSNTAKLVIDATDGDIDLYVDGEISLSDDTQIEVIIANGHKVKIYHTGSGTGTNVIDFKVGSELNITGGNPTDFTLFTDTTENIEIRVGDDFSGLIYAPSSDITVHNDTTYFGAIWGGKVNLTNTVDLFYDTALQGYLSDDVIMTSWKQELD